MRFDRRPDGTKCLLLIEDADFRKIEEATMVTTMLASHVKQDDIVKVAHRVTDQLFELIQTIYKTTRQFKETENETTSET